MSAVSESWKTAQDALALGEWQQARRCFEAILEQREAAEALEGLGMAAWWLDDMATVFDTRERAFHLYRKRGETRGAGRVAQARPGHDPVTAKALAAEAATIGRTLANIDLEMTALALEGPKLSQYGTQTYHFIPQCQVSLVHGA